MNARNPIAGPFVPPHVARFARRRLAEALGVIFAVLAVALAVALATYDSQDPSLNTASASAPANLLGAPGAIAADILVQTMGLAAWLLGPLGLAWAWRLTSHVGLGRVWLRIVAAPVALIAAALALAAADRGGVLGSLLFADVVRIVGPWSDVSALTVTAPAGIAALTALVVAMGLSITEWRTVGRATWQGARYVGHMFRPLLPSPDRRIAAKPASVEATDGASARREPRVAPPGARRSAPIVETPKAKPRTGKRAAASRQAALEFEGEYQLPSLELLDAAPDDTTDTALDGVALEHNARILETVLDDFGVKGDIVRVRPGPVVTLYELEPAPGTKSSRVIGLADDIARSMSAVSVRIAVIPGRNVIGI